MENAATLKESVKAKLKQKAKMTLDTLQLPEPKIASEYYSQDEMVKFNKPKKKVVFSKLSLFMLYNFSIL